LELVIQTLKSQKDQIFDFLSRTKDAFPSETLKDAFGQLIEVVQEGLDVEE